MPRPVARLTTPAQMVASLPLWLGFLPTESLVVCCHEPRGRIGLTVRFDLPAAGAEHLLAAEAERRVRQQQATRVLLAVYTAEADGPGLARSALVDALRTALGDLVVTEAVLVRTDRFWSYLCADPACCPPAGTPVDAASGSAPVRLLQAEQVLDGRAVLPDRAAFEASLAGPTGLAARAAVRRCEIASALLADAVEEGPETAAETARSAWWRAVARFGAPPAALADSEAATLAVSLVDVRVRDELATAPGRLVPSLLAVVEELARRTPPPYDVPVCALLAWLSYRQGGGATVTIALERALDSDPDYGLAQLLQQAVHAQVPPSLLRRLAGGEGRDRERPAC
jgi:hypothetical protein